MNLKTIKKIHQICIRKGNYEKEMKWRVLASACAAAVAVTSMPYMATQVHAEPAAVTQQTGNNDLKLWYTSPADITKYYQGWQEKSFL